MSRRSCFASLFAALAFLAAGTALWDMVRPAPLNVILLSVEGMRADSISATVTPNLWRAAEQGIRFQNHRAVSAWTAPNVIALLTGVSPFDQGIHTRGNSLPEKWRLPLEELADAGWQVAGVQPFMRIDLFRNLGLSPQPGETPFAWLTQRALRKQRFFFWSHYVGTHLPYKPGEKYRTDVANYLAPIDPAQRARLEAVMRQPVVPAGTVKFEPRDKALVKRLHAVGFREFDDWFGQFWEFFERSGLRNNTVLVITADHGEELLERGLVGHASTTKAGHLFEELVRTQLLVWLPPGHADGKPRVLKDLTNHLDVMPTLLRWIGHKPSHKLPGIDLLDKSQKRVWQAVTSQAGFAEPDPNNVDHFHYARLEPPWKLHVETKAGQTVIRRLFNLSRDPSEEMDLATANPGRVVAMADQLLPAMVAMRPPTTPPAAALTATTPPRWRLPQQGGRVGYDDFKGRFRLEWDGADDANYVIQYEAGEGALALKGELAVQGRSKDFGDVSRRYWNTWIVPYGRIRLRVGVAGADDRWSDWIEMKVAE